MTTCPLKKHPVLSAVRHNHALEHATLHVLSQRFPGVKMAGVSIPQGFFLFADLPTEIVTDGVLEAQRRLEAGEKALAIHPNCGTNLVTSASLAGALAWAVLFGTSFGRKPRWFNYILAVSAAVPVFLFSKPLGLKVQENLTTDGNLEGLKVRLVTSQKTQNSFIHLISTGQ